VSLIVYVEGILAGVLRAIAAAALAVAGTNAAAAQDWRITEGTTALTGAPSAVASLDSVRPLSNMLGLPETAALVVRCSERVLSTYVVWPQVLSIDGTREFVDTPQTLVLWRVDDGKIDANFWDRSTDGIGAGKFTTGGAIKILRKLRPARKLVVRMTGTITQDAEFDLADAASAIAKVERACGISTRARP
jgi:hypothetical protein